MITLSLIGLVALLTGCGPTEKWINTLNEPSGQQLRTRYVTSTKSVKVYSESRGIRLYIQLPDSVARVNRAKLGGQVKKFDFGKLLQNNYDNWIEQISSQTTESTSECKSASPHKLELSRENVGQVNFLIGHNSEGQLYMSVNQRKTQQVEESGDQQPKYQMSLVSIRVAPPGGKGRCITGWKDDAAISEIANEMLDIRDKFASSISDVQLGDVYRIGNKLKRQDSIAKDTNEDLKGSS